MWESCGDSARLCVAGGGGGVFRDVVSASPTPLDVVFVSFAVRNPFSWFSGFSQRDLLRVTVDLLCLREEFGILLSCFISSLNCLIFL